MRSTRTVTVSVLLVLLFSVGSLAAAGAGARGSIEGTFVGIEEGNPKYFLIKETGGGEHRFVILEPGTSVQPYLDNPSKFKGRAVKVYWHKKVTADGFTTTVEKVESLGETKANGG